MARFLAIDWDHHQLHVIAASITGNRITIQHSLSWPEPNAPNPAQAVELGKQLKDRLKSAGIAPAPVLACVGRDRVIPKDVRHPAVGPADEPFLIRNQVVKELTDPPDEVVIDYTPLGSGATPSERRSLALVVRKELLESYQAICQGAGLKLAAMTPRMFGIGTCFRRVRAASLLAPPAAPEAIVAVVALGERWAEFTVLRGETLLFARSMTVSPNMAGEVRRNLAVYSGQFAGQAVEAVYIAGTSEHLDLQQKLQGMLTVPVALFDPFAPVDRPTLPITGRGGFAGALGLIYLQAAGQDLPINFVRPKQPVVAKNPNRRLYVLVACLAGLLLLGGVGYWLWRTTSLDSQLADLAKQKKDLESELTKLDEEDKRFKHVDEWKKSEVVWLDEFYDLTDRLGDGKGIRLVQINGDPLTRTNKSDLVARLTIKGIVGEDIRPVDTLFAEMVRDGHYRVEPKHMSRNTGIERQAYPQQFVTKVDIKERTSDKFVRKMPDPPKETPRPARSGGSPRGPGGAEVDPLGGLP